MVLYSQSLFQRYFRLVQLMEGQCIDSRDPPLSLDIGPGLGQSEQRPHCWRVVRTFREHCSQPRPPQKRWVIDREGLRESDVLHLISTHQVVDLVECKPTCLFKGLVLTMLFLHWARWAYIPFLTIAARDIQSRSA